MVILGPWAMQDICSPIVLLLPIPKWTSCQSQISQDTIGQRSCGWRMSPLAAASLLLIAHGQLQSLLLETTSGCGESYASVSWRMHNKMI